MTLAAIVISARDWLVPATAYLIIAIALLAWTYIRAPADKWLRTSCAFLKLLGLAALLLCLLDPLWTGQRARPGANFLAIVADNSQGLNIKDRGTTHTRGGTITNLLAPRTGHWQTGLEDTFQVRRYLFDSRLQSTKDFSELAFDGRASSLGGALRALAERFRGQPLAGVLLFTDGIATDLPDGRLDVAGLPPVYPVIIGRDEPVQDIAIQRVALSQTAFEDAPVTVQADVMAGGYAGRMLVAQLRDATGRVVEEQSLRAGRDSETFRFQVRPERPGVSFYEVLVSAKDELNQFARPESSAEATLENNRRALVVDRGQGPYRVLYVGGRPNWEFKFLNRALAEDDQVQLAGLIRIARREPKFDFRGRAGEFSNPLFRGFDRQGEDAERYDQPVLKWLLPENVETNLVAGGFPKVAADLFQFHAVILDDLESEFFTRDQMTLLQKFVSERGGGLLMLGGAESFHEGKFAQTPIGEMLPVYVDYIRDSKPATTLQWRLTAEGRLQPWARLRDTEAGEKQRLAELASLQVLNRVRDVKPGASVVAEVTDETGRARPALVAQRFGNGRVGAVLPGDLWRWGLRSETARDDLAKAWRQMIRWLIADVPARIEFGAEPRPDDPNQAVALRVRVRDKEFKPLDNATVKITVSALEQGTNSTGMATTNSVTLTAEAALNEAGLYEANYVPRVPGGYLADAVIVDGEGIEVGRAQTGWTADPAAEEFKSLRPNRALLENLARQTGGEVLTPDGLESLAERLPNANAPITESWSAPLWHKPAVFLFALACFVGEWGLRRWKGMA